MKNRGMGFLPVIFIFLFGFVFTLFGAPPKAVFRSVAPGNTAPIAVSGANALNITGDTAVFSMGLPDSVGVGDAITYQSDSKICFIHERIDTNRYLVKDTAGNTTPPFSNDRSWNIFRAYISLENAVRGNENPGLPPALRNFDTWTLGKNISATTGSSQIWNIACYGDNGLADTTPVYVDDSVQSPVWWRDDTLCFINIFTPASKSEAGRSQRHGGVWDSAKYRLEVRAPTAINVGSTIKAVRVNGLQVRVVSANATVVTGINCHSLGGADFRISNCIIRGSSQVSSSYFDGLTINYGVYRVWNNIIYDIGPAGGPNNCRGINLNANGSGPIAYYLYNNTIYNCGAGITKWGNSSAPAYLKNNLCYKNGSNFYVASGSLAFDSAGTNNLSGPVLSGAPGANPSNAAKVTFVDSAKDDFRLSALDTGAKKKGADLSSDPFLAIKDDIAGRKRFGQWDIGAYEVSDSLFNDSTVNALAPVGAAGNNGFSLQAYWGAGATAPVITFGMPNNIGRANVQIELFNTHGQKVAQVWHKNSQGSFTALLCRGNTPAGVYVVRVTVKKNASIIFQAAAKAMAIK